MDPCTKVIRDGLFSTKPPDRSSSPTTSWPVRSNSSTTWDPINPAQPVTREIGVRFISRPLRSRAGRAIAAPSMRPPSRDDHGNRLEKDQGVEPERPVGDVGALELDDALEVGDLVAPGDLPRAGDPRLHVEARVMVPL